MAPLPAIHSIHVARIQFRDSSDPRPVLVLRHVPPQEVSVALISSAMDLFERDRDFLLEQSEEGFAKTGLKKPRSSMENSSRGCRSERSSGR